MPQSFKYAWRWLTGASAAAMLIASIPAAANAQNPQIITLCVGKTGKVVAVGLKNCRPHQIQLTWNIPGPAGDQGSQGDQGATGVKGEAGPVGTQGPIGDLGLPGLMGTKGATGTTGQQGPTGDPGPIGNTGPIGTQGPTGPPGDKGTNGNFGDSITTLTGGTMGDVIGPGASIQLTSSRTSAEALYMAPGNAASVDQPTVEVPTPGGEAFHLRVRISEDTDFTPGYQFIVCDENTCDITKLACTISGDADTCIDNLHELDFLPGDTISIKAYNSLATTPPTVDVSWSLDYSIQTTPDD